jgi:hypothetical protein
METFAEIIKFPLSLKIYDNLRRDVIVDTYNYAFRLQNALTCRFESNKIEMLNELRSDCGTSEEFHKNQRLRLV